MPMVSKPPVRGTQTFVGVMAWVWGRPSLMALEVAWRWLAGLIVFAIAGPVVLGSLGIDVHSSAQPARPAKLDLGFLQGLTVFQPVHAIQVLHGFIASRVAGVAPSLWWVVPVVCLLWLVLAGVGRTLLLRRLDPALHARPLTMVALGALRAALLAGFWAVWVWLLGWATRSAIMVPSAAGQEPNLVQFAAMAICGTLLLYVLWGMVSWPFQLAPLLAMLQDEGPFAALRAAFRAASTRGMVSGKLMEVNLVMNIVKLALIVLAMVFSASPLPFTSVATQTFLTCWWTGVILLYFAVSDYFHVVRAAAYLRLWRADKTPVDLPVETPVHR